MADLTQLDDAARKILRDNDRGGYTVPTEGLYPYQWNWDSAFAALGFATFDLDRAWTELETLFSGQWETGMVPHILFHQEDEGYFPGPRVWGTERALPSSGITQPPVAATVARRLLAMDSDNGLPRVRALYPKLLAWHRWFMQWREHDGAICITHPWESGRDNAPDWDGAMQGVDASGVQPYTRRDTRHVDASMRPTKADYDRFITLVQFGREHGWDESLIREQSPFRVADPTITFILLRAMRDLAAIADELSEPTSDIDTWTATLTDGTESLWNDSTGAFDARDVRSGKLANSVSNASFLAWYASVQRAELLDTFDKVMAQTRYGVPSHPPHAERFDAMRYWRGPVWAVMNYMIATGLAENGHTEQADRLREHTRALISEFGFAEYFNPLTGTPAGGGSFTWTAAIWLIWASPSRG